MARAQDYNMYNDRYINAVGSIENRDTFYRNNLSSAKKQVTLNRKEWANTQGKENIKAAKTKFNESKKLVSQEKYNIKNLKAEKKILNKASKGIFSEGGAKIASQNTPMGVFVNNRTKSINNLQQRGAKPMMGLKYVAPGPENLFIGARMTKGAIGLAALGVAAVSVFSGASAASQPVESLPPTSMGSLSGMSYDGSGNVNKGSRTLGATGDLVFGLNKMRRTT